MEPRIAVIRQDPVVTMGLLEPLLAGATIYEAEEGLPASGDFDGLVVLGGRMSVEDDDRFPYLNDVNALMMESAQAGVPVLAICLGIQQLAKAAGGRVEVGADEGTERGIVEVTLREEAREDPVLGRVWERLGQKFWAPASHNDAVGALPEGARWLACSQRYPYHALRVGSALGVQFHPEADVELLRAWSKAHGDDRIDEYERQYAAHAAELPVLAEAIAEGFLENVRSSMSA
ncbi:MAG: type 1 glutamine amidotransferase [Propionibacteriaceae bacterium]|nr:type 1 glutamine amidotransferase [Propionibacteriaceae bacterium]